MSDTEAQITKTVKTKDPRRVEAGRRLGLMSKAAKEKKMREKISSEREAIIEENSNNTTFLLALGAALVVTAGGYYAYSKKSVEEPKVEVEVEPRGVHEETEKSSNLVNYFD